MFSFLNAQIVFNELMIDPDNDNTGEFIEIYNGSDSIIDLREFYLCDAQDTDAIIPFPDSLLSPGQYGLILDPDYDDDYLYLIPDSIPIFSLEDSRFGMYGISNSTSKPFSILNTEKQTIDTYLTGIPFWPSSNHTIERRAYSDNTWNESLDACGTPGFRNSTAIKNYDILINDLLCLPENDRLSISFTIKNTGSTMINEFTYGYIVDIPGSNRSLNDTLDFSSQHPLFAGDSLVIECEYFPHVKGTVNILAFAYFTNIACDTISTSFFIPLFQDELIVTEFVPKTGEQFTSEYIEILSRSNKPIQLTGLEIHDLTGHTHIDTLYLLHPDSMLVLAQSASFHDDFPHVQKYVILRSWRSLNNSEDLISFSNPSAASIIDLHYNMEWDIPNDAAMQLVDTSLDYNNPVNWEISYTGSPGMPNITQKQLHHLSCVSNKDLYTSLDSLKFIIVNDGYFMIDERACTLSTRLSEQIMYLPATSPGDTFVYRPDTTGLFLEGTNSCTLQCKPFFECVVKYYKPYSISPVFFNEIMFDPIDTYGQVEFIELECPETPLDMDQWRIKINHSVVVLHDSLSNTYTAICDLSDPVGGISESSIMAVNGFPTLPNAGAECYLMDPEDRIMDHVDLCDHKKTQKGKSLEKQFPSRLSSDRSCWFSSVSDAGMSPGRTNSITALPAGRSSFAIYPECFDPNTDDRIQFSIDSDASISFCEILCFNLAGQCIYRHEQHVFSNPSFLHFWDGRMDNGAYPSRGIYLVVAALYDLNGNVHKLGNSFVVR